MLVQIVQVTLSKLTDKGATQFISTYHVSNLSIQAGNSNPHWPLQILSLTILFSPNYTICYTLTKPFTFQFPGLPHPIPNLTSSSD